MEKQPQTKENMTDQGLEDSKESGEKEKRVIKFGVSLDEYEPPHQQYEAWLVGVDETDPQYDIAMGLLDSFCVGGKFDQEDLEEMEKEGITLEQEGDISLRGRSHDNALAEIENLRNEQR